MKILHNNEVHNSRKYLITNNSLLVKLYKKTDKYGPVRLQKVDTEEEEISIKDFAVTWREKVLHGRFTALLEGEDIDTKAVTYVKVGELHIETRAILTAIQDQVIPTRSYLKHIIKENIDNEKCRICNSVNESIQHITSNI